MSESSSSDRKSAGGPEMERAPARWLLLAVVLLPVLSCYARWAGPLVELAATAVVIGLGLCAVVEVYRRAVGFPALARWTNTLATAFIVAGLCFVFIEMTF